MYPLWTLPRLWAVTGDRPVQRPVAAKRKGDIMIKNESTVDRIIRAVVAVAAIVAAVVVGFSSPIAWVLVAVAAIMGVTAAVGFCPLYRVFGLSTCPVSSR